MPDIQGFNLTSYLTTEASYEKVNAMGKIVFHDGHIERLDEFIEVILPIVNMAYYQYVKPLDEGGYSYEDLVQDSILTLYRDLSLRWDKLIDVFDYFSYFKTVCKNVMLNQVHGYHDYYLKDELDTDIQASQDSNSGYNEILNDMTVNKVREDVIALMRKLVKCRVKYQKAFDYIIKYKYEKSESSESIRTSLRVLGINRSLMNFMFDHLVYLNRLAYNYQKAMMEGNMADQIKFEDIFSRFEEPTYKILANNYFDTILPEYFAEFGAENTKKFIKLFGGRQISVPGYNEFSNDLLGGILLKLTGGDKDKLYQLSNEYGLKYSALVKVLNQVEKFK